jgi:ribonuclease BN (tRNA processing enzyme)
MAQLVIGGKSSKSSDGSKLKILLSYASQRRTRIAGTLGLVVVVLLSTFFRKDLTKFQHNKAAPTKNKSPNNNSNNEQKQQRLLDPWRSGLLDIHHLQLGSSVSTFVVMPDGTTMLIDCGDVNVANTLTEWSKMGPPFDKLNLKSPFPDDSKTPVDWTLDYLKAFWPASWKKKKQVMELDYLLLTHFHSDHMGDGNTQQTKRAKSSRGNYVLSGIPELASKIKVQRIIDRGYPDYNVPMDLKKSMRNDISLQNYLQFVKENQRDVAFEKVQVGSSHQIRMQHDGASPKEEEFDDFRIRVIKSGLDVAAPRDETTTTTKQPDTVPVQKIHHADMLLSQSHHGNENTMSAALVIDYGSFRYYEGADQEVVRNNHDHHNIIFDTIGPTARAAGKVDVATLNHHGHGVNQDYLTYLDPPIMVLQGWSSDQPPKKSMDLLAASVLQDGSQRKIFATDIFQERLDELGPLFTEMIKSTSGHVVVRVHPQSTQQGNTSLRSENERGARQTFEIVVLDGDRRIKQHYGHFPVRGTE